MDGRFEILDIILANGLLFNLILIIIVIIIIIIVVVVVIIVIIRVAFVFL